MFTRVTTPKGSTLDELGQGIYQVCDRSGHCRSVEGLARAQETMKLMEQGRLPHADHLLPRPVRGV